MNSKLTTPTNSKNCLSDMYTYYNFKCEGISFKLSILVLLLNFTFISSIFCQKSLTEEKSELSFFQKSDTLNKRRLIPSITFSAVSYTGFSIGLYQAWYKNFDQEPFHFFDDRKEWRYMDKYGHFYTAYFQGVLCYKGAKWTGLSENNSILTGFIMGSLFQSTLEVMDGFSSKWGFSMADVGMNFAGSSSFVLQQKYWGEQRIHFKMGNVVRPYNTGEVISESGLTSTTLEKRSESLFGSSYAERFLKDYNSQVYWACVDVRKFAPNSSFPKWLNIAIGFSAGNLYGGHENRWEIEGEIFDVGLEYPRYSRFLIAPDINLSSIRTRSYFINGILDIMDVFHMPLPAIEINTLGEFKVHFLI